MKRIHRNTEDTQITIEWKYEFRKNTQKMTVIAPPTLFEKKCAIHVIRILYQMRVEFNE